MHRDLAKKWHKNLHNSCYYISIKNLKYKTTSFGRCGFCFGEITMNYTNESKKKQQLEEKNFIDKFKKHKCYGCFWGTWTGLRFFCIFPKCVIKKVIEK